MIGHRLTPIAILDNVTRFWDLSKTFPVPHRPMKCPVCREQAGIIRRYLFFVRSGVNHDIPHRCDVYFKCQYCSCAWGHGLPITEDYFNGPGVKKMWSWREVMSFYNGDYNEEDWGPEGGVDESKEAEKEPS
jgi:hypothetical protein